MENLFLVENRLISPIHDLNEKKSISISHNELGKIYLIYQNHDCLIQHNVYLIYLGPESFVHL